jgi:opacity protein-like surface antigen
MMRTLSVLLLLLFSTSASAERAQGFYIAGGLMTQSLSPHMQSTEIFDGPPVALDASESRYNSGGTLLVGYQLPLADRWVVMLEAGTDLGTRGTWSAQAESGAESLDVHWKIARSGFLAVKPGRRLGEGLVAYLLLAYHHADADLSRSTIGSQNNTRTGTRTIGGAGIGLGLQGQLSDRVFIRGEVEHVQFSRTTIDFIASGSGGSLVSLHSIKPEAMVGRVIVGYRF